MIQDVVSLCVGEHLLCGLYWYKGSLGSVSACINRVTGLDFHHKYWGIIINGIHGNI